MIPAVNEGLDFYLDKIGKFKPLRDLENATREEMITSHLRYVVFIAKGYSRGNEELLDLIQEGNIGLIKAVDTRKPGYGLAHWASFHIRNQIRNYLFGSDALDVKRRNGIHKKAPISYEEESIALELQEDFKPEKEISILIASPALTEKQKNILARRVQGVSLKEIARLNKVTHQAVSQIEQAAIKILKG